MATDIGGIAFLLIDVIFVLLLAGAMIYGTLWWRRRKKPAVKTAEKEAVRGLYHKAPGEPTAASPERPKND